MERLFLPHDRRDHFDTLAVCVQRLFYAVPLGSWPLAIRTLRLRPDDCGLLGLEFFVRRFILSSISVTFGRITLSIRSFLVPTFLTIRNISVPFRGFCKFIHFKTSSIFWSAKTASPIKIFRS